MADVECLVQARNGTGECPVWDEANNRLLWTDIPAGEIYALDWKTRAVRTWRLPGRTGSFGLARSGRWVVAVERAVYLFDPLTEALTFVAGLPDEPEGNRANDGKVGPDGAFWVGTMDDRPQKEPRGSLYRVTAAGTVEKRAEGLVISNGLAWSPDGRTMYHADSRGPWVDAWDFDPATGATANRRRFLTLSDAEGRPDGAAVDAEGCYWVAGPSAQCVNRFDAQGNLLEKLPIPAAAPTMPCFGGPDGKWLFVTSLSRNVPPEMMERYPLTGSLFAQRTDVTGTPIALFAD